MYLFIFLIVAAVIGWVATELMYDRSNLLINIIVAVLGTFLAGFFISPLFHNDAITTSLVTLLSTVILLTIVVLFLGRGMRWV